MKISRHIRRNLIGYLALFVALSGTAWASGTVGSADVIDNSLRRIDLKDGAAVQSSDVVPGSLTGADIDEATLAKVPNADKLDGLDSSSFLRTDSPAGGDVFGDFSSLALRSDTVGSSEVKDGSLQRTNFVSGGDLAFGMVSRGGSLSRSWDVDGVTHPSAGVYCITARSPISANSRVLVATPNFAQDSTTTPPGNTNTSSVEWDTNRIEGCPAGTFEVNGFIQHGYEGCGDCARQNVLANEGFYFEIR